MLPTNPVSPDGPPFPARPALALAFAFAAAFLAASPCLPAAAQTAGPGESEYLRLARRPPGATPVRNERTVHRRACRRDTYTYGIGYVRGIDGGGPVDRAVAAFAGDLFSGAGMESIDEFRDDESPCEPDAWEYFSTGSAEAFVVSPSAYSVLFSTSWYTGGTHPVPGFAALNLRADGSEITLHQLFPDSARSLPLFTERVYRGFCSLGHDKAPFIFGYDKPCWGASAGIPEWIEFSEDSLDAAGHSVLTEMGLSINLIGYEAFSHADGPHFMDFPKEVLIELGADPAVWR
jgi:hypothetical protein